MLRYLLTLLLFVSPAGVFGADIFGRADEAGIVLSTDSQDGRLPLIIGGNAAPAKLNMLIEQVARRNQLDAALLHAVIKVESNYNSHAVSHKGALGLMQIMPATARRYGVKDALDAAENIRAGAKYLSDLLLKFGNNLPLALAAYNAGEDAVRRYGGEIPPYHETIKYVPMVLEQYRQYRSIKSDRTM